MNETKINRKKNMIKQTFKSVIILNNTYYQLYPIDEQSNLNLPFKLYERSKKKRSKSGRGLAVFAACKFDLN